MCNARSWLGSGQTHRHRRRNARSRQLFQSRSNQRAPPLTRAPRSPPVSWSRSPSGNTQPSNSPCGSGTRQPRSPRDAAAPRHQVSLTAQGRRGSAGRARRHAAVAAVLRPRLGGTGSLWQLQRDRRGEGDSAWARGTETGQRRDGHLQPPTPGPRPWGGESERACTTQSRRLMRMRDGGCGAGPGRGMGGGRSPVSSFFACGWSRFSSAFPPGQRPHPGAPPFAEREERELCCGVEAGLVLAPAAVISGLSKYPI